MKKVYHLTSCNTCQRILKEVNDTDFVQQCIKATPMTAEQVDEMAKLSGSYESLFSRRAMKYKELGLKEKTLSEEDYRAYILEHYTFLKRPVFVVNDQIYVGNSKKNITKLISDLG